MFHKLINDTHKVIIYLYKPMSSSFDNNGYRYNI